MNSFDVFDTLIGRLCYKGIEIFGLIESITGISDFKQNRIRYESSTLEDTYKKLGLGDDIKELELKLEYEFSFPIWKYLNQISQNDILISDMYLSEDQISKLINKHTLVTNKIYASPDGKSSGKFWKSDISKKIRLHTGDNYKSDFLNAKQNNIDARWIDNVELTKCEKIIESIAPECAYILRALRLSTQHLNNNYYNCFINIVLPLSIIVIVYLKTINIDNKKIIFISRDGYWIYHIYKTLYPNDNIEYYYFSRLYSNSNNKLEIHSKFNNTIVFDLQGSGKTLFEYNTICKPITCFIGGRPFNDKVNYLYNIYGDKLHLFIEDLFSAPHGSIGQNGNILDLEYNPEWLTEYMKCFHEFEKFTNIYSKYITNFKINKIETISSLMKTFLDTVDISIVNSIKHNFNHVDNHASIYKKHELIYYSQIGQDKYYVENIIKFKPNGIFLDIGGYDGITGSNTFFLEKNLNWRGLIVECNPSMSILCKKNRTNPVCEKAIYKISNTEIDFLIPEGEDIEGGKEQLSGIKDFLKGESLNGFRKSYNVNRIIKVPTININDLLDEYNLHFIDYMSLDVEGYELEILKELDTSKYKIKYLTVEHGNINNYKKHINDILLSKGYMFVRQNKWDSEYVLK